MDSRLEEEKTRVIYIQLISLIKEEEKMTRMMLNELHSEASYDLIYLNSQLGAEKARLAYLCSVLLCKRNNEELDLNSIQMRLSTGSSDDHSNPFIENQDSSTSETFSALNHGLTRRFSERFSVNINQHQLAMQASLRRLERKVEILTENLEDKTSELESEQKRNENLKELVFNAQEKIKTKDAKINNLQNEIKSLEDLVDEIEKNREAEVGRIQKNSSEEVEKIKSLLNAEREKSRKNEEENKEIIEKINSQVRETIKNNKILTIEKEVLTKNIAKLNEDIQQLHRKHEKIQSKMSKQFEIEKESWEIEHKSKIDELKFQIKTYEDLQDMHSSSEHTENELSELDEQHRYVNSEPCALLTFDKKISYDSIKFLESFEPNIDESLTSCKSQQVSSTCQTEGEMVGIEDFDSLLIEKQETEKNLKTSQDKVSTLESQLSKFQTFTKSLMYKLELSCDSESFQDQDFQYIIQNVYRVPSSNQSTELKSQPQSSFMINFRKTKIKKPCLLFWKKTNPIVSSLFG